MDLSNSRKIISDNATRVAEVGTWPAWIQAEKSLLERIPGEGNSAPGFDAGLACALDLIPREKQALAAGLHARYTPERVAQVRREIGDMIPADSETCWWLAACSICEEGGVDVARFAAQLEQFERLAADPQARRAAALTKLDKMMDSFELDSYGVAFGTVDGAIQGANISGYSWGTAWNDKYGLFFIGTYEDTLGLESFEWSSEVDAQGRAKSGPVFGSKQYVKCCDEAEFRRAIAAVKERLG